MPKKHALSPPVLREQNGRLVSLAEFVEVLDGLVDYEEIQAELPGLSHAEINRTLTFIRSVMATLSGDAPDEPMNDALLEELRAAIQDQEVVRVLKGMDE